MSSLETLLAKDAIRDLSTNYMRGLDRMDGALQLSTFWPDAMTDYGFYKGGATEFVTFCQDLLQTHLANQHLIGQSLIEIEGDIAFGEIYYSAFHRIMVDDVEHDMIIAGRYVDRYEKRGSDWKIAFRSEIIDWARQEPAADSFLSTLPDALRGKRGDKDISNQKEWLRKA